MVNARRTEEVCIDVSRMSPGGLRADWEMLVLDYGIGFSAHLCPSSKVFRLFLFFPPILRVDGEIWVLDIEFGFSHFYAPVHIFSLFVCFSSFFSNFVKGIGFSVHFCPCSQVFPAFFFFSPRLFCDCGIGFSAYLSCLSRALSLTHTHSLSLSLFLALSLWRLFWEDKRWSSCHCLTPVKTKHKTNLSHTGGHFGRTKCRADAVYQDPCR